MPKESLIANRLKSITYALKGAILLIKTETSIQVQIGIGVLLTIAGFYFNISRDEWIFQLLAIGLVIGLESINTSIEAMADFIHPNHHQKIGFIKDIAAGAVFIASIIAVIIGLIIYFPKVI